MIAVVVQALVIDVIFIISFSSIVGTTTTNKNGSVFTNSLGFVILLENTLFGI